MLKGFLEIVNGSDIAGWAWDDLSPGEPVIVDISVDNGYLASVEANIYRPDLEQAGIGNGKHSFSFRFPHELSDVREHVVRVRAKTGAEIVEIAGSPHTLRPALPPETAEPADIADMFLWPGLEEDNEKKEAPSRDAAPPEAASPENIPGVSIAPAPLAENSTSDQPSDAALRQGPPDDGAIEGHVDEIGSRRIAGWAQDRTKTDAPVSLLITDNDILLARVMANRFRPDLELAGIGKGRCAFELDIPGGLSPFERHEIRVRRETDGSDLLGSPLVIEPTRVMDAAMQDYLADFFEQARTVEDISNTIDFMAAETAKLMRRLASLHSKGLERHDYRQFISRWRRRLPDAEAALASHKAPKQVLRALVIDELVPKRDRDAGSHAILSHVESLQRLGFEVSFVSTAEFRNESLDISSLDSIGVACCRAPFYASVEEVLAGQAGEFDVIYLHRIQNAARYMELARGYCPKARLIYSVADLYHIRIARQATAENRPELAALSQRIRRAELLAAAAADAVITHSTFEAAELVKHIPSGRIHVIPWAVPPRPAETPFSQRSGIAFIGGYAHQPNVDAAHWLISDLMPRVRQRDPGIRCLLVGSNMPESLRRLNADGIESVGFVEDLSTVFNRVRLTVAPLAFGAGVKGKVLESIAAGIPCVCTPVAAEGIALPPPLQALVAEDADKLADAIHHLHSDEAANMACRESGLAFVAASLSTGAIDTLMEKAIGLTVNPVLGPASAQTIPR